MLGGKQGTTMSGLLDAWAIAVSHGLQWGVPLESYVGAYRGMRFDPAGLTDDPDFRVATSLPDYLMRAMALRFLDIDKRRELGVLSTGERMAEPIPGLETAGVVSTPTEHQSTAPLCLTCGIQMVRAGSCYACAQCGTTSGCS